MAAESNGDCDDSDSCSSANNMKSQWDEEVQPTGDWDRDDSSFAALADEMDQLTHPFSRESIRVQCYPHGLTPLAIPLALSLVALILSGAGSYDCSYFQGATISFTGGSYGLWTLRDGTGKCQLWDALFFNYKLGTPLIAGRVASMMCLLLGLAIVTTMTQALQFHAASWGIGFGFFMIFMVSLTTSSIFNMWVVFWSFTYVIYILLVRFLFIHPVHRLISARGHRIIAGALVICAVCCLLTLVVLKSDFCTCNNITAAALDDRDPGNPCDQSCRLGAAGYLIIVASGFWLASSWAVLFFGIQPDEAANDAADEDLYDHYPIHSITTRVKRIVKGRSYRKRKRTISTENAVEEGRQQSNDPRRCCAKICCDFRVVPRNRREKCVFWSFRTMLGVLVAIFIFVVTLKAGSRSENNKAAKAPDTSAFFLTDEVCAFNQSDASIPFQTFATAQLARDAGYNVSHCGACGQCSNAPDIKTYVETRKTIANSAKECSVVSVFGGYGKLVECLEDKIDFTRDCTMCWANNMVNTRKNCLFTCLKTLFTGGMKSNNVAGAGDKGWLNQCLFCDEKMSGPGFVTCSGVARRRLGIQSEIERSPEELCTKNDVDWLDDWENIFPNAQA